MADQIEYQNRFLATHLSQVLVGYPPFIFYKEVDTPLKDAFDYQVTVVRKIPHREYSECLKGLEYTNLLDSLKNAFAIEWQQQQVPSVSAPHTDLPAKDLGIVLTGIACIEALLKSHTSPGTGSVTFEPWSGIHILINPVNSATKQYFTIMEGSRSPLGINLTSTQDSDGWEFTVTMSCRIQKTRITRHPF